jgi:putative FmdB family regulatory protein
MPTYEYECQECGHTHEEVRTMAQGPHTECQRCGAAVKQKYGIPILQVGGYSPAHPRKLRGRRGAKPKATG